MTEIKWSQLPALTTLRAFEATARLQGYSAASRELNVTPAAIAQQVRKLEKEIGMSLVRREGRGLVLSQAGEQLARPLKEAFSLIANGIHEVKSFDDRRGVRVSTTDYFASTVILPRLAEFWAKHPTLQASFSPEGNTAPIDLENFDIVIRGDAPNREWDNCKVFSLLETPMIIYGAPSLVGNGKVDVASMPWIADRGIGGSVFREAIKRVGCDPDSIKLVDSGSAKLEMDTVLLGYGLHFGPKFMIQDELANGSLVEVDVSPDMRGVYYAICRKGPISTQTQKFLDWLVEICAPLSCTRALS